MGAVRLAVIGAGLVGERHIELVRQASDCKLVAVVDPEPAIADVARRSGATHYVGHDEMLANERLDGAIVAVPTDLHVPVGAACARHGVHMLMEKPIAGDLRSARDLIDIVERSDVRLAIGHYRRFDPAVEAAREIVSSGEIGRLLAVSCVWAVRKPESYYQAAWRRGSAGGPILINLSHDIDCLRFICGDIESVSALTSSCARGFDAEDTAVVSLRFASGALGSVAISDAAPSPWGWESASGDNPHVPPSGRNCCRFLGTRGALDYPNLALWRHADPDTGDWSDPLVCEPRPTGRRAALAAQLAHFCRVVRGREEPRVNGRDGFATLAAVEAVRGSSRTDAPVVPETYSGIAAGLDR